MFETLAALARIMHMNGATKIYAKKLAPNDNSKNQVYLGGDFSVLNVLPHGEIQVDNTSVSGSIRNRAKAGLNFFWIDEAGRKEATAAQLILYPKYPEVRLSGFLKACRMAPSKIMRSRDDGRVLFMGVSPGGSIFGYASAADSALSRALHAQKGLDSLGVFLLLPSSGGTSSKNQIVNALKAVCAKGWIPSEKLGRDGVRHPYTARNGGGFTLEAHLGIHPNSKAEPDYLGWEIKQYGVTDFVKYTAKSYVTLFTPEPSGGVYKQLGFTEFMRRYGYPDKGGAVGRTNFGGRYTCNGNAHANTGLRLRTRGYDLNSDKITDMKGGVVLLDRHNEIAAEWPFTKIIEHWKRKHAQVAYVPSMFRSSPPEYQYGPRITLCEGTDFFLFLQAVAKGTVFLDPALKLVSKENGKFAPKNRNQFRIGHSGLTSLYHNVEVVNLDSASMN